MLKRHNSLEMIINEMNEILNEQKSQCSNNVDNQRLNQTIRAIQKRNMRFCWIDGDDWASTTNEIRRCPQRREPGIMNVSEFSPSI
jgi:predicted transglutaminase-like protease